MTPEDSRQMNTQVEQLRRNAQAGGLAIKPGHQALNRAIHRIIALEAQGKDKQA